MAGYLDFEIEIGNGVGRKYPLAVIHSPGGEASEKMVFPFDELALEIRLKDLQIALLQSGGQHRLLLTPQEQTIQDFGQKLFGALMTGEVRSLFDVSLQKASSQDKGLRIKLRIQPPELASLPWEFLFDTRVGDYVCLSPQTPIIRYIEVPQAVEPLTIALPLKVLAVAASPIGLAELDIENEKQRMGTALKDLIKTKRFEITWLEHATWRTLQNAMREGPWHVLHFVGHGGFDKAADEGILAFEDESGGLNRLPATQLARILAGHTPLRLVVLNSCEGAEGGNKDVFSSTASILVRHGIPAVLAMQYPITDRAAIEFSRGFYEAIADGLPVDAATTEARKSICLGVANTYEWGTPVLFMHTPDGILFKAGPPLGISDSTEITPQEPPQPPPYKKVVSEEVVHHNGGKEPGKKIPLARIIILAIIGVVLLGLGGYFLFHKPSPPPPPQPTATYTLQPTDTPTAFQPTSATTPMRGIGSTLTRPADGMMMVYVPEGAFTMGDTNDQAMAECQKFATDCKQEYFADEQPPHPVFLDAYWIDKTDVSNAMYAMCVKAKACQLPSSLSSTTHSGYYGNPQYDNYPVIYVNWNDASDYCAWAGVRLPSEAEWEKAARGTDGRTFPWGDNGPNKNLANYKASDTVAVGSFPSGASPYGALDMAGNVWNWVNDWYDVYPDGDKSASSFFGTTWRVSRGGTWASLGATSLRSAYRASDYPVIANAFRGFRCAANP